MESTGLQRSDPRLKEMVKNLESFQSQMSAKAKEDESPADIVIGRKEFKE